MSDGHVRSTTSSSTSSLTPPAATARSNPSSPRRTLPTQATSTRRRQARQRYHHWPWLPRPPRMPGCWRATDDLAKVPVIMGALDPGVVHAVWAAVEPLLPPPDRSHPLGCHRPRVPDRVCFWSASTARCTRRPTAVREPTRTPLIERSRAGSGRWRRNATASPSAGRSTAPTATTSACSMPLRLSPARHRPPKPASSRRRSSPKPFRCCARPDPSPRSRRRVVAAVQLPDLLVESGDRTEDGDVRHDLRDG
jgi:hypothetical protein